MSVKVQVSKVIDRSVADVFRIHAYEHVRNHPRWDPLMQLEDLTDGPMGVGDDAAHIVETITTRGRMD